MAEVVVRGHYWRQHGRVSVVENEASSGAPARVDVLVVGAGPTGLTLAGQLAAYGVSVRIVDPKPHPVMESRALAVQPRTLEVLRGTVTARLLERGNPAVHLHWHADGRSARLPLFDMGMADTAYPYLLFLSQAETEAAMVEHLAEVGVTVEWGTRLLDFAHYHGSGQGDEGLECNLVQATAADQHPSTEGLTPSETLRARYVVGCDGAHSRVRELAGITFAGGRYPQTFLLADLDADGLDPGAAHVWFGQHGPLFFFPLRRPAAWRVLTPRPDRPSPPVGPEAAAEPPQGGSGRQDVVGSAHVTDAELQDVVDAATGGTVRLSSPIWSTVFRIHHRHAETYRSGSVFLAGDAAHIHSPAGAQGMNTGIQDAANLGWKLGLVCHGRATPRLLDTYDRERRPVGAFVLRFTNRAFTAATSSAAPVRFARTHLAPRALGLAARVPKTRAVAFRTVSQLGIRYPNLLTPASSSTKMPTRLGVLRSRMAGRRAGHPRPGERLPDAQVTAGQERLWMHDALTAPGFHLLLCGPAEHWDPAEVAELHAAHRPWLHLHQVLPRGGVPTAGHSAGPVESSGRPVRVPVDVPVDELVDTDGVARRRWHIRGAEALLVRPDGHVAARDSDANLDGVRALLANWLTTA